MARPRSRHPTELELEILKILWRAGPMAGRRVQEELASFRTLAYTSVTTILNIMARKGYLKRSHVQGGYVYRACISEQSTGRRMLRDLLERVFHGSAANLLVNLFEASDLDSDELRAVRDLIDRKTREQSR